MLGGSYIGRCARNMARVECSDKWYEHSPKSVEENEGVKLLWDFTIQTDHEIHLRRPDIVIQKKKAKETIIVDIVVAGSMHLFELVLLNLNKIPTSGLVYLVCFRAFLRPSGFLVLLKIASVHLHLAIFPVYSVPSMSITVFSGILFSLAHS